MSEEKEKPPAIGNILLNGGKAQIMTEEGLVAFDLGYVLGKFNEILDQIKKALRGSKPSYYTGKIQGYYKILKDEGIAGIETVLPRLKVLSAGREVNKEFTKHISMWLNQISEWKNRLEMFKNIKNAPPKEEVEKVLESIPEVVVEKSPEEKMDEALRKVLSQVNPEWGRLYQEAVDKINSGDGRALTDILSEIDPTLASRYKDIETYFKDKYNGKEVSESSLSFV